MRKKVDKDMPRDRRKVAKMWLRCGLYFRANKLLRSLPKTELDTHHMHHSSTKGKKALASYSIRDIYTLTNREVIQFTQ